MNQSRKLIHYKEREFWITEIGTEKFHKVIRIEHGSANIEIKVLNNDDINNYANQVKNAVTLLYNQLYPYGNTSAN